MLGYLKSFFITTLVTFIGMIVVVTCTLMFNALFPYMVAFANWDFEKVGKFIFDYKNFFYGIRVASLTSIPCGLVFGFLRYNVD